MLHRRPSPCIGVCSTTYGDLVCRGCNRFAHEVVQWNAYDDTQRGEVWRRLDELRDGALKRFLSERQVQELCASRDATQRRDGARLGNPARAYAELRRLAVRRLPLPWDAQAAPSSADAASGTQTPSSARRLLADIDREFHNRALAAYERNFKVPAE